MTDTARLTELSVARIDDGAAGYSVENAFGQTIRVLPQPPAFCAHVAFEWRGAMPEEIVALLERAKAAGITVTR